MNKMFMIEARKPSLASHLSALRARASMSLEEVALEAGYKGRSSVQRYFEDDSIETLAITVARKLASALYGKGEPKILLRDLERLIYKDTGGNSDNLASLARTLELIPQEFVGPEIVEFHLTGSLPIVGTAKAGNWAEQTLSLDVAEDQLFIPFSIHPSRTDLYALRIAGNSLNEVVPDGYFAICRRQADKNAAFSSGSYVHVQRVREDLTEWTIKKMGWTGSQLVLSPNSSDPDHKKPIPLGDETGSITILGVVVAWYMPI